MDASVLSSALLNNCLVVLGISILYYDYIITLGDEVSCIWTQPKRRSSYVFLSTRYLGLFGNIIVTIFNFSPLSPTYYWLRETVFMTNQFLVSVLLALRTYALYGQNVSVLAVVVVTGLAMLGVACWSLIGQETIPLPQIQPGCHFGLSAGVGTHFATPWEMLFFYDSMIFAFTLFKSCQAKHKEFKSSLATCMFRDGSAYFLVMLLSHLGNILTFYMVNPLLQGCMSTFTSNVSITMMSRLMINLHKIAINTSSADLESQLTSIQFTHSHGVSGNEDV